MAAGVVGSCNFDIGKAGADAPKGVRPILCINALDDPVCTRENIDYDIFNRMDDVILVTTPRGSHVCFFEGRLS